MIIGEVIRSMRQSCRIKQYELAERIGVTAPYMSQIEYDKKFPSHELVVRIAQELNTSAGYLYFRALYKEDFPKHKQALFEALYPTLHHMIERLR